MRKAEKKEAFVHMVKLYENGVYLLHGRDIIEDGPEAAEKLRAKNGHKDFEDGGSGADHFLPDFAKNTMFQTIWRI